MNLRAYAILAVSALVLAPISARANVVILGAPNNPAWNNDVQSKILASGVSLGNVDIINIASSTPTLATLQAYEAVLVYTDNAFTQNGPMGNVLADYVDWGGGVVQMTFSNATLPLGGRWDSGGYNAISLAGQATGQQTMGTVFAPGNPLFNGVTSFNGGTASFRGTGTVINGATLLANWSDGSPLAALLSSKNAPILSLNFFPPSSDARADFWTSSTDGARLMANALAVVGGRTSAVPEPSSLVLCGLSSLGLLAIGLRRRRHAA